jgi:hypothetical protein
LIGPEALETDERFVERLEFIESDLADLLDSAELALIKILDDFAGVFAFFGEADADGAAVDVAALVVDIAHVDELFEIVGHVRAEVIAACLEFTGGQFARADVIEQQRLYAVEFGATETIEFVFDDIEKEAMETLDQTEGLEIFALDDWVFGIFLWRGLARNIQRNAHSVTSLLFYLV